MSHADLGKVQKMPLWCTDCSQEIHLSGGTSELCVLINPCLVGAAGVHKDLAILALSLALPTESCLSTPD